MLTTAFSQQFCGLVDWVYPGLPARTGDDDADARAVIRYLRERERPVLGYSPAYVARLRELATPEQRAKAEKAMAGVLAQPLNSGVHNSPLLNLGADAYQLAGSRARFLAMAEKIAAEQADWGGGAWGSTCSICGFLQQVWPLEEFPDEALLVILSWLHAQQQKEWAWARTWSEVMLGTSGHNWWLHTFAGFWKAGLFFPEIADFAQFAAFAPNYLEHEMSLLMEPDGFTKERSGYHWGTARMFMEYTRLAELNGITFSAAYYAKLRAIANVDWQLVTPDGDVPLVGDTSPSAQPGRLFSDLRLAAARCGIGEAKYVAAQLDPAWRPGAWLPERGEDLLLAFEAVEAIPPAEPDTALPHSGYYVMRENWTPAADWALIDAGARGNTVTSHDHTAIFHLLLSSKGRPILVDNCSGPYGEEPSRLWRVGSSSHNVATVDDRDHLPMRGEWRWESVVMPTIETWRAAPAYAYFSGVHEGYARPVLNVGGVRRKLFYLRGGYWILIDRFTVGYIHPDQPRTYRQHFHLGVPAALTGDGRVLTTGDGGNLLIVPVTDADASLEPNPYPLEKYDNPDHLSYTRVSKGNDLFVTLLVPFTGACPDVQTRLLDVQADSRTVSPWEITGLEIVIDGQRDVYVDTHMQWNLPWHCAEHAGTERLFHSRIQAPNPPRSQ
ncbi:MAG: Heparinase II/III-like protein [bacterium ADurb.Bin429]|nr:MAG: Heparinase II/III-like protein [bacterium ADurb.Bin429]